MKKINKKFTEIFIIFFATIFAFVAFEIFLIFENKSKKVERTLVEIQGINYDFINDNLIPDIFFKKNNEKEIFIIGDSFAEGVVCAANKENLPCHLERIIDQKKRVLNLSLGGKNPAHYIDIVDQLKISDEDIVTIVLYDNDLHLNAGLCKLIKRQSKNFGSYLPKICLQQNNRNIDKSNQSILQKINNKIKKFKVIQLLKESMVQIPFFAKNFYRNEYRNRWTDFDSEENKWIISSLKVMKNIVRDKNGLIHFIYYPNTNKISKDDNRHVQWLNFINHVKKNHNINILDPYPYIIDNSKSLSMVWSLSDKHPNCEAHKLMAEFISQEIDK